MPPATFHFKMKCVHCDKMHDVTVRVIKGNKLEGKFRKHTRGDFDDNTSKPITVKCEGSDETVLERDMSNATKQAAYEAFNMFWKK